MSEDKQVPVPKWLEDLQHKSWEPEILLSGIVLYGMFKVPELLDDFLSFFKLNIFGNSTDIDNLVALSKMGIYWLITGLIMHLICRGIWIGMVGLSYTFPEGIRLDKISYQEPFKDKVARISSYEAIVIRLEKISSTLFSVSFMLFMSLIGGYLFFLILVILPLTTSWFVFDYELEGPIVQALRGWIYLIVSLGVIGLIDFLSLGYFRRFKIVAKIYWPLHRFISTLTLSRFYRPIYYGMVTNFNKWVVFLLLLTFTVVSIFGAGSITDTRYAGDTWSRLTTFGSGQGYASFVGYYDDQNEENPSVRAHIPSDIINGNVLRLFVVANIRYEENMNEHTSKDSLRQIYPDTLDVALTNMVVANFFDVHIDGKPVEEVRWYFHYKRHLKQRGYLTYINIKDLEEGMHQVEVRGPEPTYSFPLATIPFYKDLADQGEQLGRTREEDKESNPDFQPKPFGVRE